MRDVSQTAPCLLSWRQTRSPYKLTQSTGKDLSIDCTNGVHLTLFRFLNLQIHFLERESVSCILHALSKHPESVVLNSTPLINFYDAFAPTERSQNVGSIPPRAAELIAQMNRHPRFLSLLGILPNRFRTLLKESNHENREEAILDLNRTLFFAGFRIWNRRQKLASRFWKDIAPENRNVIGLNSNKGKKKNKDNTAHQMTKCKNPFHFLRRYRNLSNKRETRCPCSKAPKETKDMPNHRITRFLCMTIMPIKSPSESTFIQSRTDKIRAQHDRGKTKKFQATAS